MFLGPVFSPVRVTLVAMTNVALIGGGKMGSALLGGLLDGGWDADEIAVAEVDADRRRELEREFPKVRVVPSPAWAVADADVVIVAVKPADVASSLEAAESSLRSATLVLSIAAGVTIATLEALVPGRPVVRAMPNTPALVGLGASAIAAGRHADEQHLELAVAAARHGRHRRHRRRGVARRGHRAVGIGPGVHLSRRRGDDRSRRARRAGA